MAHSNVVQMLATEARKIKLLT